MNNAERSLVVDRAPLPSDDDSGVFLESSPTSNPEQVLETAENPMSTLPEAVQTKEYVVDGPTIKTVRAMSEPVRTRRHISRPHVSSLAQRVQDALSTTEGSLQAPQPTRRIPAAKSSKGFQRAVQQAQQGRGRSHISPRDTARRLKERAQQSTTDAGDLRQDSISAQKPGFRASAELERRAQRMQKSHRKKKNGK